MKKPLLSEMTLREKIGQMLMPYGRDIYCRDTGKEKDAFCERADLSDRRSEEELAAHLKKENFGACRVDETDIFEAMNPDGSGEKINASAYRAFLAKQDAWGTVPTLMAGEFSYDGIGGLFAGMTVLPPPLAVGAADSEALAYALGGQLAKEMCLVGANLLLGPEVNICHRFSSNMMRTFVPDDASRMACLAAAYIKGVQENGVAVSVRHFPGGDRYDYRDPDVSPTVISSTLEEWENEQGKILRALIASGAYSVTVNHAAFPAVDDSTLAGRYRPASVSAKIVTEFLKGALGFEGVVIADSIASPSLITSFDTLDEMLIALVNAGNDIISGTFAGAGDIIERAVLAGAIPEARINDACARVLAMKEKLGLFSEKDAPMPDTEAVTKETRLVCEEIAKNAITKVLDSQNLLPVKKEGIKTATIVYFAHTDKIQDAMKYMKQEMEKRGIATKIQHRVDEPIDMERVDMESDLIIYVVAVAPNAPKGHPGIYGAECAGCQFTFSQGQKKSIGISMGYPYIHYDLLGNAETFINTYGFTAELIDACVNVIFGEDEARGNSPVKLIPDEIWY